MFVCDINVQRQSKWVGVWLIEMFQPEKNKRRSERSDQAAGETVQNTISDVRHYADDSWIYPAESPAVCGPRNKPRAEPASLSKGRTIQSRRSAL